MKLSLDHHPAAPSELKEKFDKANKDYLCSSTLEGEAKAVVYQDDGDFGVNWKLRIWDMKDQTIIAEHLNPVLIDGHTCYLICSAVRAGVRRGVVEGHAQVAEKLAVQAYFNVFGDSRIPLYENDLATRQILTNQKIRPLIKSPEE